VVRGDKRLPDKEGALFLADVDIEVPESYLPTTPYRMPGTGSVFFPVGKWRGWFNDTDLRLLQSTGGRILTVHMVYHFEPFEDLRDYAETLYQRRIDGTTDFEKTVYKLLLNSLYGKFGENPLKSSLLVHPSYTDCPHEPKHRRKLAEEGDPREPLCMTMIHPGIWTIEAEAELAHEHVPIASHITSLARANIWGFMRPCRKLYYCDTDGFATNEPNLPVSAELGGLKLELVFGDAPVSGSYEPGKGPEVLHGDAEFFSPKIYRIGDESDGANARVKAKGMSLADKRLLNIDALMEVPEELRDKAQKTQLKAISLDRWVRLRNGQAIEVDRITRLKEMFRAGITSPVERTIKKELRGTSRAKRKALKDGDTVPWHVKEIEKK
jgi:hypothetical protein